MVTRSDFGNKPSIKLVSEKLFGFEGKLLHAVRFGMFSMLKILIATHVTLNKSDASESIT